MRILVEDVDSILAREIGKALPEECETGKVELEISGIGTQEIYIVSTSGRYGGFLRWFICPACNRRVGKLYLPTGKYAFLCRYCYNLGYRAQQIREFRKPELRKGKKKKETLKDQRMRLLKEFIKMMPDELKERIKDLS